MFFNKRHQLLTDIDLDKKFHHEGFLKFGKIDSVVLNKLKEVYFSMSIPDSYGFGFNVGLNTESKSVRKNMQDEISKIIEEELLKHFVNRKLFTATFMNKVSGKKFFLPPHQDWTYTNESIDDSVMCWIPLTDVTEKDGAMCFMPMSHKLFKYDRAFPLPYMPSPVNDLKYELLPFMRVVEALAGEIILINHKTVHASLPNLSSKERIAVGVSLSPRNQNYIIKCLNPKNKGKTVITYEVDKDFLVQNRHVELAKSFDAKENYNFNYKAIKEQKLNIKSISLRKIKYFALKNKLEVNTLLKHELFNS